MLLLTIGQLQAQGSICTEAESIGTGEHSSPNAPYWYSFTVPESGKKVVISSVGLTNTDTYLLVYADCGGTELASNDDFMGLQSQVSLYQLEAGETIFILWDDAFSSQSFNWKLSLEDVETGEVCVSATEAVIGTNSVPALSAEPYSYWFKFNMPEPDAKIVITSAIEETIVGLSGTCEDLREISYGFQDMVIYDIDEGQDAYIRWTNYSGSDFSFNLAVQESEPGESCSSAVTATEGPNSIPATDEDEQYWYEFTMPVANAKLRIVASSNDGYFVAFRNTCGELQLIGSEYDLYDIGEGEKIFIAWNNFSGQSLDWTLSVLDSTPGESCSSGIAAVQGQNMVPVLGGQTSYWYAFTMPQADSKVIITSENGGTLNIYSGTCPYRQLIFQGYQNLVVLGADLGEEIHFEWTDSENFTWNLAVEDLEPGDICTSAVTAVEETNTLPTSNRNSFWYTFTVPEDDLKLIFPFVGNDYFLQVFSGSCDNLEYLDSEYGGNLRLFDLAAGEELIFMWQWLHDPAADLVWELIVEELVPGDRCELPVQVNAGNHTVPYAPFWYAYTIPEANHKVVISSVGLTDKDTYLVIVDDCNGSIINTSDDFGDSFQSQVTLTGLAAGETILIYWSDGYSTEEFNWKLTLEDLGMVSLSDETIEITLPKGSAQSHDLTISNTAESPLEYELFQSRALSFDGYDDYVYIPESESLSPDTEITLSMWVNLSEELNCDGGNNFRFLVYKGFVATDFAGYDVILEETGSLTWSVATANGSMRYSSDDQVLQPNQWTYLTFTYTTLTSEANIYFNGERINGVYWDESKGGSTSWGGALVPHYTDLLINYPGYQECADGFGSFPGMIDDFSIWSVARTEEQIKSAMNNPLTGAEPGLSAYWDFEESGTSGSISDLSSNANHGYPIGASTVPVADIIPWISFTPLNGEIEAGSSATVSVNFHTGMLGEGNYQTRFTIGNALDNYPLAVVQVTLTVQAPLSASEQKQNPFFASGPAYPNPLREYVYLPFTVSGPAEISFMAFSLDGKEVFRSGLNVNESGMYELQWDGKSHSGAQVENGMYMYRLEAVDEKGNRVTASHRILVAR